MEIRLKHLGTGFRMQAENEEGNVIAMDASPEIGGAGTGMRPMQVLLSSLGGCTAIDVLLILKKQKLEPYSFEIVLHGTRRKIDDYSLFREITLEFIFSPDISHAKAEKAVRLSMEKYCSVAKTLEPTAKINYKITIR